MSLRRPQQFVGGLVGLSLLGVTGLAGIGSLSAETVTVTVVIAALLAGEATAPTHVRPQWRRRLRAVLFLALLAFVAIVGQRAIDLWPTSF